MRHRPSPTLQPPSSRPLERWPASGEARVNLWAVLIGGAARPPDAATPSQVDEATEPRSRESLRSPLLGQGTVHAQAATATLRSHSRSNKIEVGPVASCVYGTPSCVSSKWGLDASGVILTRPSAPPVGLGRRFSRPQKTWGGQGFGREAMLTWLGRSEHPAPQHTTPSASSGPWWPYCAVAPLASPVAHRRMGRGHIWKQRHPPPPPRPRSTH